MIERLIQTIKRRLSVLNNDTNWSKITLADKIAEIIQEIKIIPNTTTKIAPYTSHFGRKINTQLSNIITKPSHKNLSYKEIKNFYLDKKRGLQQPMLNAASIWNVETDSEPELDIRFQENTQDEESASDDATLQNVKRRAAKRKHTSPIKITPDKLMITFGDKTTTITNTKKQVARKTLARRAPEPRGTLKPLWNIIPDGTITNYSPTTITLDTHNRKDTVIRKNDLAIVNESKPRLMHFVACKTVREYKRNQEKIKEFLLTEKKNQKAQGKTKQKETEQLTTTTDMDQPGPSKSTWTCEQPCATGATKTNKQRRKTSAPSKRNNKPNKDFEVRSKEAALAQSRLEKAKQHQLQKVNSPRIQMDTRALQKNKSIEIINLASDSSQESPIQIFTSDNPNAFMIDNQLNKDHSPSKREAKIDKIIKKLTNSPKKTTSENDTEQIITIIPATTPKPTGDYNKDPIQQDNEQLITIIPTSTSTPIGNNNKDTQEEDNEQEKAKPTGTTNINEQYTQPPHEKSDTHPHILKDICDAPEERQDTNTEANNIHIEDQEEDNSGTSSISSLNTADIEALNRIFD